MNLIPVHDKIVVKLKNEAEEKRTESGLILPDTANQGGVLEGDVVAASGGIYSSTGDVIPVVVKKGNKVLIGKHHGGQEYTENGQEYIIISQNEVLAIVGATI
tara:strand:- start:2530 stop:2838 length:309 start_codon:yes stop_codon:yes gene_type:complete